MVSRTMATGRGPPDPPTPERRGWESKKRRSGISEMKNGRADKSQIDDARQQEDGRRHSEVRDGPVEAVNLNPKEDTWMEYFFGASERPTEEIGGREQPATGKTNSVSTKPISGSTWFSWMDPSMTKKPSPEGSRKHKRSSAPAKTSRSKADAVKEALADDEDDRRSMAEGSLESELDGPSKLFSDLASLPSAKTGMTADGSVKTFDLGLKNDTASTANDNMASVVESKVKNIKFPGQKLAKTEKLANDISTSKPSEQSMETRRQLLVKELRTAIGSFGRYDIHVANISAALGDLLDESKQYDQAIKLHRDAVEIYSSKLGDDHTATMEAKLQLGKVLENSRKYDEAVSIYSYVTAMRRALKGEKDPSAADSLVKLAHALRLKADYNQAIKELKRALKIYRESLGDAHQKVSKTVDEIASLYVTLGDFEKSAAILEEVVKLKAATQGMRSEAVASTLTSLATTYECSEDFTKAMKSLKKAYKIYTEMDGYSSKDATSTLNRIAQLYEATGDSNRASIAYLGVLRGRKNIYGDDHLRVGETYYKLGHTLRESGQLEKALTCTKEALPIFVGQGVEMHDVEMIAEVMHEMALIHKEQKRFQEAARIFKQELGVRRKINQPDFPLVARTLNHLGVTEYALKNNNRALKYLIEALTIFKDGDEKSVDCAEVLFNTGLVFESSRNKERALEAYEEAARIFTDRGYKQNHPHLVKAHHKIEKLQGRTNGRFAII